MQTQRRLVQLVLLSTGAIATQEKAVVSETPLTIEINREMLFIGSNLTDDVQVIGMQGISPSHCLIHYDAATDQYEIIDNHSKQGTRLNRFKLNALDPHPLDHQDEIELGEVSQGGALLRFVCGHPESTEHFRPTSAIDAEMD